MVQVGIVKERKSGESRVAASPETVKKLAALGLEVVIETGAGQGASIPDAAFEEAGAALEGDATKILKNSDIVLKVQPPFESLDGVLEASYLKKGAVLISHLSPFAYAKEIETLAGAQVSAFSMEMVPRITRAQSMDVLSSQSNLTGYKAVLDAVDALGKVVPMMMTAAGTVQPAKALILGAGVAGLQAIATAKRLGAVVSAFDVRPAVKEQVESLGATFIEVASEETENAETKGGYAKEMSKEYQEKQKQLIFDTIIEQDIVVTTALIPGKLAPVLITKEMVKAMKPGAVIVDLAALAGGNCEYTQRDKVVNQNGVTIIGYENVPSRVAHDASLLYAKNLLNFVTTIIDKESGNVAFDVKDEVIDSMLLTNKGKIVHKLLKETPVKSGAKKKKAANSTKKKPVKKT